METQVWQNMYNLNPDMLICDYNKVCFYGGQWNMPQYGVTFYNPT